MLSGSVPFYKPTEVCRQPEDFAGFLSLVTCHLSLHFGLRTVFLATRHLSLVTVLLSLREIADPPENRGPRQPVK
jgi:hypothetical protein